MLVVIAFLQGCSGSSSSSDSLPGTALAEESSTSFENESNATGSIMGESIPEMEQTEASMGEAPLADTESNIDVNSDNDVNTGTVADTNTDSNIDAPDPMVQNRIDVSFEVTVPAYQSNELQVKLSWGEFNTSLAWIGDELWSTNANLPTDTEALLSIVFYDDNGNIELGSYEKTYRSGTNAAEIYQVSADQFDTSRWDEDGDGVSNLDELIAGTAPDVDEDNLLEIFDERRMGLLFIANYFETIIGNERPNQLAIIEEFEEWHGRAERADKRESGNDLWRVNSSFESINNTNTSEYFARELTMHQIVLGYQRKVSEHDHFFCRFADL